MTHYLHTIYSITGNRPDVAGWSGSERSAVDLSPWEPLNRAVLAAPEDRSVFASIPTFAIWLIGTSASAFVVTQTGCKRTHEYWLIRPAPPGGCGSPV